MKLLIHVLITAAALWITTRIVPGIRIEASIQSFLVVAVVFGLVNAFVRPVARLLSLPIRLMTLGLFSLVINASMLMLTAWLVKGAMSIEGNLPIQLLRSALASIVISLASTVIGWIVPGDD